MSPNSNFPNKTSLLGKEGEEAVANWLKKNKFKILEKNYHKRCGEIDIVAMKNDLVVFVEVKTRKSKHFPLSDLIVHSKQQKIILTAKSFVLQNNLSNKILRFDVALVEKKDCSWDISYIPNAFTQERF